MGLVRNLLDIRAIEDEGIKIKIKQFNLLRVASDVLKANKSLADIKHIKLRLTKLTDEPIITSDKLYVTRILENLLSNALKFSEKDTIVEVIMEKTEQFTV